MVDIWLEKIVYGLWRGRLTQFPFRHDQFGEQVGIDGQWIKRLLEVFRWREPDEFADLRRTDIEALVAETCYKAKFGTLKVNVTAGLGVHGAHDSMADPN